MLLAQHRAANEDPPRSGEEHQVDERLALGGNPGGREPLAQVLAGQRPLVGKQVISSERSSVSARSTSAAVSPLVRARTESRAPRGSCPCTASSRSATASGERSGSPARAWAVSRSGRGARGTNR
jgi:hypothetical protein